MLRISIAVLTAVLASGVALAQPADLTGRWIAAPLVDRTACTVYRRTGTFDLRQGKVAGSYVGQAQFTIERIATGEPGCIRLTGTVRDQVEVAVMPCASDRVPIPSEKPWPGTRPCFDVEYRKSRLRTAYAAETWRPAGSALEAWGPRFALPFGLTRAPVR
jgi:hypothetical protein